MNVRIGNDIKVQVPLSEFSDITSSNIEIATCAFKLSENDTTVPTFHQSSFHTIHGSSDPIYNVNPSDYCGFPEYEDPHDCEFVISKEFNNTPIYVGNCTLIDDTITCVFPALFLILDGVYDCCLDIKIKDTNWNDSGIHSYRQCYENAFTLSNNSGSSGSITIDLQIPTSIDTYLFAMTDEEFNSVTDGFASAILEATSINCKYTTDVSFEVEGSAKHVIIISSYNNLGFNYNQFVFPFTMYTLDNGSYLYKSKCTYSNITLPISIKLLSTANISNN